MLQQVTTSNDRCETGAALKNPSVRDKPADRTIALQVSSDIGAIEAEWREFETRADCTPFQSYDWLSAWQACIGRQSGVRPVIVCGRASDGQLLFILPLALERKTITRRLVFLGRGLCDYNAPVLSPDFGEWVGEAHFQEWWDRIAAALGASRDYRYDVVFLDKMPERVGDQANPLLTLPTIANENAAYLTRLDADWQTFYEGRRSSATRRRDRTKRKRLSELGETRASSPTDAGAIQATLGILFDQKSRSFARHGIPNFLRRPGREQFFRTLADRAGDNVHVGRLDVGGDCVATNFGLVFHGRYYHILAGHDDGPANRFGPGIVHLHEQMKFAIGRGCDSFDFTVGREAYKLEWADTELRLRNHLAAASWAGVLPASLAVLSARLRLFVKETPALFTVARHLRRLAGRAVRRAPDCAPVAAVEEQ